MGQKALVVAGGRELTAALLGLSEEVGLGVRSETRAHAEELRRRVITNASTGFHAPGRPHIPGTGPGPNVATGGYIRTIRTRYRDLGGRFANTGGLASGEVYTDDPRAERLEHGAHGVDSAGRLMNSPPYPHWGPATDAIEGEYEAAIAAVVAGAIQRGRW